jgi:hypothetical protein
VLVDVDYMECVLMLVFCVTLWKLREHLRNPIILINNQESLMREERSLRVLSCLACCEYYYHGVLIFNLVIFEDNGSKKRAILTY